MILFLCLSKNTSYLLDIIYIYKFTIIFIYNRYKTLSAHLTLCFYSTNSYAISLSFYLISITKYQHLCDIISQKIHGVLKISCL